MTEDPASPTPEQEKQRRRELNRPTWAIVLGLVGVFPLAIYFGVRALMDRKRAIEGGRGYERWGTAAAVTGILLGVLTVAVPIPYALTRGDDDDSESAAAAPAASSTPAPSPDAGGNDVQRPDGFYGVGDSFRDGSFEFTVVSAESVPEIEGFTPTAGAAFVRVVLDATNQSSQPALGPMCAPGYNGVVLIDDQDRNYSVNAGSAELSTAVDPYCTDAVQPGLQRRLVLAFQIPEAAVGTISGVAVWDPAEPGDPSGEDTYYFVEAPL